MAQTKVTQELWDLVVSSKIPKGRFNGFILGNVGNATNNMTELHALEHGLAIAKEHHFGPLAMEGGLMLTTLIAHKLQQGSTVSKVIIN